MDNQQSADLPAMLSAAATLQQSGRPEEACAILVDASACFPNEAGPWHDMARLAEAEREWNLAEACWRRFLDLDDSHLVIHTALAATLREQRRHDEAESVLSDAEDRLPDQRFTFATHHATIAEMRGDGAAAERRWDDIRTRFPDEWPGHRGHA